MRRRPMRERAARHACSGCRRKGSAGRRGQFCEWQTRSTYSHAVDWRLDECKLKKGARKRVFETAPAASGSLRAEPNRVKVRHGENEKLSCTAATLRSSSAGHFQKTSLWKCGRVWRAACVLRKEAEIRQEQAAFKRKQAENSVHMMQRWSKGEAGWANARAQRSGK